MSTTVTTELQPQQQRVLDRLQRKTGLVVAHGLGSGKTLASIAAASEFPGDNLALVPASLEDNYLKEIAKHVKGEAPTGVSSLQRALRRQESPQKNLLIVDEAHRARNAGTKLNKFLNEYPANKKLLLTASPVYNSPSDIASLVNMAAGRPVVEEGREFDRKYVDRGTTNLLKAILFGTKGPSLKNSKELSARVSPWVDYHKSTGADFPREINELVRVPMSKEQTDLHAMAVNALPLNLKLRIRANLPVNKKGLSGINQFEAQTRQLSGSTGKYTTGVSKTSPKILKALDDLEDRMVRNPRHKAVIYSNYLDTLKDYSNELSRAGIPHATFSGEVQGKERDQLVRDYNAEKIKALLVSSAGGEGLDLKNTRQVQVLEPHWNEEKLKQVIGRAVRHKSHNGLPEKDRSVEVQRYITYPEYTGFRLLLKVKPIGVEDYLYNMSQNKERLNAQVKSLLTNRD